MITSDEIDFIPELRYDGFATTQCWRGQPFFLFLECTTLASVEKCKERFVQTPQILKNVQKGSK